MFNQNTETMKVQSLKFIAFLFMMFSMNVFAQDVENVAEDKEEVVDVEKREKIIADAEEAKRVFKETNPNMENLFQTSAGYAIFPNVGKGAYILGGAAGNGVVYENDQKVGFAELRQIDVGLQLGGQAYRQVVFFETPEALNRFKEGSLEFGGNVSAVIVEEGEAKSINFNDGIAVAILPKAGAMLEISVGGQKFYYADMGE